MEPITILPHGDVPVLIQRFERMEVPALTANPKRAKGRVCAVLEEDGTGNICASDMEVEAAFPDVDIVDFTARQMEMLHYRNPGAVEKDHHLRSAVARFRFANEIGSLSLLPTPILFHGMHNAWLCR